MKMNFKDGSTVRKTPPNVDIKTKTKPQVKQPESKFTRVAKQVEYRFRAK